LNEMKKLALDLPGDYEIESPEGFSFAEGTIGDIITDLLPYIYVLAGLILFIYLIIGGFSLLTSAGDPKKVESAQGKITSAIVGFLIIFISYWIIQILEIVFGIEILGLP